MKTLKTILLVVVLGSFATNALSQDGNSITNIKTDAYKIGEILKYRLHYGFVDAGEATLEVKSLTTVANRAAYYILGTGISTGTFNWFFKVRDKYETYIDKETMSPLLFKRDVNEGGYTIKQNVSFNQVNNTANSDGKKFNTPKNVQDILSAFYYTRCINYTGIEVGEILTVITFLDDEVFPLKIKYGGKKTIKTKLGTFKCLKFTPLLQEGRIFKAKEDMTIWISDDENHIPISIEANILFGSIKADLSSYKNLSYPVAKVK